MQSALIISVSRLFPAGFPGLNNIVAKERETGSHFNITIVPSLTLEHPACIAAIPTPVGKSKHSDGIDTSLCSLMKAKNHTLFSWV